MDGIKQRCDDDFESIVKELGFDNKLLTSHDLSQVFEYMQEIYSL